MKSSKEIRNQFIEFFADKGHKIVSSASLIPRDDPTLLFTNAGMNQFKDIFLGKGKRAYTRAVNSQKCLRAGGKHNDLEEVGKDDFHHTFFEMLGNWSFGDYYKAEAIKWAWELLTEIWQFPKEKLFATVHNNDDESFQIWKKMINISKENILKFGDKDNFWEMAKTGPCGHCSEIHYDRGKQHCQKSGDENHKCVINGNCGRFVEIWNLVFIQFNRLESGKLIDLPSKNVDTGAGFERLVAILQNKSSNYETDLFMPIIKQIEKLSKTKFETNISTFRVISDHIRTLTFAIADGVLPSNEGRGYVIRRILRRAARFGRLLNLEKSFLNKLVDIVVDILGESYSEIIEKKEHIKLTIEQEEKRFNKTLDKGISKFDEIAGNLKPCDIISGKDVFKLYDTFGFPMDLTKIMAEEMDLKIDEKGFEIEMAEQKKRSKSSAKFDMNTKNVQWNEFFQTDKTEFIGYEKNKCQTYISKYSRDKKNNIKLVLCKTPFYAESGGQIADVGEIFNENCKIKIQDVQKDNDLFIHFGKLISGKINNKEMTAKIDVKRRKEILRNHTATHLLHSALRKVVGTHLHQKGSYVSADRLRFDFTHFKQLTKSELNKVEKIVNEKILENLQVNTSYDDLENARKRGAMALFGGKYDKQVRLIEIADFSLELCGGIHCKNTGEIGIFKILSESSIAAGVRRIEALTGEFAYKVFKKNEAILHEIEVQLNCPSNDIKNKIEKLISENKDLKKELEKFELSKIKNSIDKFLANSVSIQSVEIIAGKVNVNDAQQLRESADYLKSKMKNGIGILGAEIDEKASLICVVSSNLQNRFHAGKIVNEAAKIVGGQGGGKADMAMAGGKNAKNLSKIFLPKNLNKIFSQMLKK